MEGVFHILNLKHTENILLEKSKEHLATVIPGILPAVIKWKLWVIKQGPHVIATSCQLPTTKVNGEAG